MEESLIEKKLSSYTGMKIHKSWQNICIQQKSYDFQARSLWRTIQGAGDRSDRILDKIGQGAGMGIVLSSRAREAACAGSRAIKILPEDKTRTN